MQFASSNSMQFLLGGGEVWGMLPGKITKIAFSYNI